MCHTHMSVCTRLYVYIYIFQYRHQYNRQRQRQRQRHQAHRLLNGNVALCERVAVNVWHSRYAIAIAIVAVFIRRVKPFEKSETK